MNVISKTTVAVLSLVMASLVVTAAHAEELKIGVLVPQKLLAKTKIGKNAGEKLRGYKTEAQESLDAKAQELKDLQEDIRKRSMVLSEEERRKAFEEMERQQREAQRTKEDLERGLQRRESEILGVVHEFLAKTIIEFGKAQGYDLIVDASATVFFSEKPDVTDEVVKLADATWKSE